MDKLIKIAVSQLGEKEIAGSQEHNPTIVQYAKDAGFDWINDDETPWCSIFVNWVAKQCDYIGTNKANARSWLLVGEKVDGNPEPGDIVIFWRESPNSWKGHVGFFFGYSFDTSRIYCLGGNQGNQVSVSAYPSHTLLGFRRLSPSKLLQLPHPDLQKNDTGEVVKQLQSGLKLAGFEVGTSDGFFGPKTEKAMMSLQAMSGFLKVDGIYGEKTKNYLQSILTS